MTTRNSLLSKTPICLFNSTNLILPHGFVKMSTSCFVVETYATSIVPSYTFSRIKWCCNLICLVLKCKLRFITNFKAFWLLQNNNVDPWTPICNSSHNVLIHVISFATSLNARYFASMWKKQLLTITDYSMLLDSGTTWRSILWLINICPGPSPSLHLCRRSIHLLHHEEKKCHNP